MRILKKIWKKETLKLLNSWRMSGYLGWNILRCFILVNETNIPRIYGLPIIHKPNSSLRPVVSLSDSPIFEIDKLFNNIFEDTLIVSKSQVKNSFEFKNIIVKTTIPSDHIMVALDVLSLINNIWIDLVMNRILNRWISSMI